MINFKWKHFNAGYHIDVGQVVSCLCPEFRDVEELVLERGLNVDETYIKVKGQWMYLYRAVDREGNTIDFMLSKKRDEPAARIFFLKAIGSNGIPDKVNMDKSGANKAGIDTINLQLVLLFMMGWMFFQMSIRQIKYLNNIVEQDHRFIKK